MPAWLIRLNDLLTARAPRERWLIYGVAVVAILGLGDALFVAPLQEKLKAVQVQTENERNAVSELQVEIAQLTARLDKDPNRTLREQVADLKKEHESLDDQLRELTVGLIQPAEMTKVLRAMLADEKGLKLLSLANKKGEPVELPNGGSENEKPYLYRHHLEMIVEGSYFDATKYLKRLEALDWTFYWDGLALEVGGYPKTTVTIRIFTLGLREGWIGV